MSWRIGHMGTIGQVGAMISAAVAACLVGLVRAYQATLSPWLGRQCRFTPTCSEYLVEAVRILGPWRGTVRGVWRVLRCNPFCRGGFDPVEVLGRAHEHSDRAPGPPA